MTAYLRAFPTLLRVALAEMTAYRAEMIIWILSATMPLVMLALWGAAAESAGPIGGFDQTDFTRYFAITLVVRQLTGAWVAWELNHQIRTGSLSPQLLRPMNPLAWQFAETLAAMPWRMLVLFPLVLGVLVWRPDTLFWPGLGRCLAFGVSVFLAFLLSYAVSAAFGILAFWWDQSLGLFQVWFFLWSLLGGYLIPLALMPPAWVRVAWWLPFHAALGAPVELLMGLEPPGPILALQVVWASIAIALCAVGWRAGIRRYGAVGA